MVADFIVMTVDLQIVANLVRDGHLSFRKAARMAGIHHEELALRFKRAGMDWWGEDDCPI